MSAGSLSAWSGVPIEAEREIRAILERSGHASPSTATCKAWARELVTTIVPAWQPSQRLSFVAAQRVGEVFERLRESASPSIADALRPKPRKPYTRRSCVNASPAERAGVTQCG